MRRTQPNVGLLTSPPGSGSKSAPAIDRFDGLEQDDTVKDFGALASARRQMIRTLIPANSSNTGLSALASASANTVSSSEN